MTETQTINRRRHQRLPTSIRIFSKARGAQYSDAVNAFQKALDLDPNDYRAREALDDAKEGTQRIKEGKKHNEEMLKKQQENANGNSNSNSSGKPAPKRTP